MPVHDAASAVNGSRPAAIRCANCGDLILPVTVPDPADWVNSSVWNLPVDERGWCAVCLFIEVAR